MKGYINGIEFEATEFFYDGCHKIYLADSDESYKSMFDAGWDENDLFPIESLPSMWTETCPLRFIMSGDLSVSYVGQFEPAEFDGWNIGWELKRELEWMKREQLEANGEEW